MTTKPLILLLAFTVNLATAQVTKTWETEAILEVPESVKFYEPDNCIFVSNVSGKPSDKDGNGFISRLSVDGKVLAHKWVDGLDAPKGMAISDGILYVSNIDELVLIDIATAKVVKKVYRADAGFLNDVTITHQGEVIVSDSQTSTIYVLKDDKLQVWLKEEKWGRINGLYAEEEYVLLGTGTKILKIDASSKEYKVFLETGAQVDGLEADGMGGYYYSFWKGELFYYKPGNEHVRLLNTSVDDIQSADIGYNPNTKEILVPTFFSNQVVAYTMD